MGQAAIHIPLSPLDHIAPPFYPPFSLYLPIQSGVSPTCAFRILHEGLHRTFVQLPWLNGKVQQCNPDTPGWRPGQLEIVYNAVDINGPRPYQLKFNEPQQSISYDELQESAFPIEAFAYETLMWAPFIADINNGCEVFVAQANFIPGGCILTSAICHPASDGTGFAHILKYWADNCNAVQSQSAEYKVLPPEISDRKILERIWAEEGTDVSLQETKSETWRILGIDPRSVLSPEQNGDCVQPERPSETGHTSARGVVKSAVFYISPANVTTLRDDCDKIPGTTPVFVNDAICALIWRCLLKARTAKLVKQNGVKAYLGLAIDGRYNFSPSLPPAYLGNFALGNMSSLPLSDLVSPDITIGSVARTIHNSASYINAPGALMAAYTLARQIPDFRLMLAQAPAGDNYTMWISSLLPLPIPSLCFGDSKFGNGGKPEAIRPLMVAQMQHLLGLDFCIILPKGAHGGVEFVASLSEEEMALLLEDEDFGRYVMFVS